LFDSIYYKDINDVYFSDSNRFPLARGISVLTDEDIIELHNIQDLGIQLNYTLNPSIYPIEIYTSIHKYYKLFEELQDLKFEVLTISNPFLLKMDQYKSILSKFNIRCSAINSVQTLEQVRFWHSYLGICDFVLYGTILRNFDELERIVTYTKKNKITLTLLVNEHCHPLCPYRMNEFAWESFNINEETRKEMCINGMGNHGCQELLHTPSEYMRMIGIGPSKVDFFDNYIDCFKLINRDTPIETMKVVMNAYLMRNDDVTLLQTIPKKVPTCYSDITWNDLYLNGFFENTLRCQYKCSNCSKCLDLYNLHIAPKLASIPQKNTIKNCESILSSFCMDCVSFSRKSLEQGILINGGVLPGGFCSIKNVSVQNIDSCENFKTNKSPGFL
jgi:collagenase-like PrtC family protease